MAGSKYGKRVIGDEAASLQKARKKIKRNKYGKRVVGEIKPAADEAPAPSRSNEQSRILKDPPLQVPEPTVEPVSPASPPADPAVTAPDATVKNTGAGADNYMNLKELEATLDANPAALDDLLLAELERPGADIRIGALRKFREVEGQRGEEVGGPREDILALIDEHIAAKTAN